MTTETSQLTLFAPAEPAPVPAPEPARIGPAKVYTLYDVTRSFLERKGPKACRFCHCTEADPCGLSTGDKCSINQKTGYCSAPRCQVEAARAVAGPVYARAGGR